MSYEPFYIGGQETGGTNPKDTNFVTSPNVVRTDKDLVVKDFYNFTNTEFINKKGRKMDITVITGGVASIYNILLTDSTVAVRDVNISRSVVLPPASLAGKGKIYFVKDISGSALTTSITISPFGTETINGDTTTAVNTNYGFVSLFTDGTKWFVQ